MFESEVIGPFSAYDFLMANSSNARYPRRTANPQHQPKSPMSTAELTPPATEEASSEAETGEGQKMQHPEATQPFELMWSYTIVLSLIHVVACLAFVPWFFSWSGVIVAIAGHFVFGMMGITIGYHRLLTHRGFTCPKWFEKTLAVLGMCNLQDSPARWVAIHRIHHQHSDHQPDPHTPLTGFAWAHFGWVIYRHRELDRTSHFERYVRDLLRDRFYLRLERRGGWFFVFVAHALAITILGGVFGWLVGVPAVKMAASWFVWGVAVRTVAVLHGTWSVNSLSHLFGYRNYDTRDHSTNNWFVALITHGEGWHNNHHAQPRAAAHGHRWWEFDMSWWVIWTLEKVGLAKDVVRPRQKSRSAA